MARPKLSDEVRESNKALLKATTKATYAATKSLRENHEDEFDKLFNANMKAQGFAQRKISETAWIPESV